MLTMGRRSVPSKRSAASMRPQGWAVVVWRTGIARKERSDHAVSQAGIWRDLGVLGQVAWEDSPHPAFGGRQVKAVVGVTWQLSYVTSPHMRVTASTRRRTPASIASCHWGRASKKSPPLLVQQYAVRLHREAYHSGLSGQLAQDVGDVVAARGSAVHRHEAPRRADAPGRARRADALGWRRSGLLAGPPCFSRSRQAMSQVSPRNFKITDTALSMSSALRP